ncbi:hypothetical protein [Streptomyces sp. NBC_01361]|uniref:hypothetical protein n=1 Tax=Streptomyces sp. NBC_01361 TaxID=2903838 RepID=UPI002E31D926|nr:hypothetical protein [Streptomyces sp. NBC_01361]
MNADVAWGGVWEHAECGASGDAVWDDEDTASSGHECDHDGPVTWTAEWECHDCDAGGDDHFDDDTATYSHHECDEDDEDDQHDGEEAA